jgi:hypothetical protein
VRKLVFWHEVGLSELSEAESRYQRILNDDAPISVDGLEGALRDFAIRLAESYPGTGQRYSQHGLVIELSDALPSDIVAKVYAVADPLGLTMYHPQAGFVLGVDDDLGVEVDG